MALSATHNLSDPAAPLPALALPIPVRAAPLRRSGLGLAAPLLRVRSGPGLGLHAPRSATALPVALAVPINHAPGVCLVVLLLLSGCAALPDCHGLAAHERVACLTAVIKTEAVARIKAAECGGNGTCLGQVIPEAVVGCGWDGDCLGTVVPAAVVAGAGACGEWDGACSRAVVPGGVAACKGNEACVGEIIQAVKVGCGAKNEDCFSPLIAATVETSIKFVCSGDEDCGSRFLEAALVDGCGSWAFSCFTHVVKTGLAACGGDDAGDCIIKLVDTAQAVEICRWDPICVVDVAEAGLETCAANAACHARVLEAFPIIEAFQ